MNEKKLSKLDLERMTLNTLLEQAKFNTQIQDQYQF